MENIGLKRKKEKILDWKEKILDWKEKMKKYWIGKKKWKNIGLEVTMYKMYKILDRWRSDKAASLEGWHPAWTVN